MMEKLTRKNCILKITIFGTMELQQAEIGSRFLHIKKTVNKI